VENVSVLVGSKEFKYWSELELTLSLDTFATLSFKAPFEPENADFRQTFRPFSFAPLKVLLDGAPLFTGTLVGVHPEVTASERKVEITGYALPGVLDDCNAAAGANLPHEYKKLTLKQIAEALAGPFGLAVKFQDGIGKPFTKVKLEEEKAVFAFLVELAQQRNLVLTSTGDGVLLCWKSVQTGNPVATLSDSEQPITKIEGSFNPQEYFSEINGFGRSRRKHRGGAHTVKNPFLTGVLRPRSYKPPDTEPADIEDATRSQLARMFANMASWTVDDLPTWRDPQGDLWQPNTTANVTAPSAMIYRRTELLVRSVKLFQDKGEERASMNVVLPGAFSGEMPSHLPWDEDPDAGF
jgi:prophage tail gpP-like protein